MVKIDKMNKVSAQVAWWRGVFVVKYLQFGALRVSVVRFLRR